MNLTRGYRANSNSKVRLIKFRPEINMDPNSVMIFKLPDSRVLGIISRSLFLAIFILALPSIVKNVSEEHSHGFLPVVFDDLVVEGLLKDGDKGFVLSSGIGDVFDSLWFLNEKGIDVLTDSDSDGQMVIPDEVFDFVFASSLENMKFNNRVVKVDGIVVMPLGNYYDQGTKK